jgi:hypothetical protein
MLCIKEEKKRWMSGVCKCQVRREERIKMGPTTNQGTLSLI